MEVEVEGSGAGADAMASRSIWAVIVLVLHFCFFMSQRFIEFAHSLREWANPHL